MLDSFAEFNYSKKIVSESLELGNQFGSVK
jgi:hypothetical protein